MCRERILAPTSLFSLLGSAVQILTICTFTLICTFYCIAVPRTRILATGGASHNKKILQVSRKLNPELNLQLHLHFYFAVLNPNHCSCRGRCGYGIVTLLQVFEVFLQVQCENLQPSANFILNFEAFLHLTSLMNAYLKHW